MRRLRSSTREFLVSAAVAALVVGLMAFRGAARLMNMYRGGPGMFVMDFLALGGAMTIPLALGIGVAWARLLRERRERSRRKPPLNLD